jgi:hypothetical protein
MSQTQAVEALTRQMLSWLAERPRTYAETMDAWRTSCPRLSVWEDAMGEGLVSVTPRPGAGMGGAAVGLTPAGSSRLAETPA